MRLFRSLFARTAVVIGVAILVYDLLTHAFLGYYLFMPMVKRSSDDLAAMMILTAESWRSHWGAPERPALAEQLAREYQLQLGAGSRLLRPVESRSPYLQALADALERRSGQEIEILASRDAGWLGLAIARQFAEANGWKVELRSRQGGGSEAVLSVPHGGHGSKGHSNGIGTDEATDRMVA